MLDYFAIKHGTDKSSLIHDYCQDYEDANIRETIVLRERVKELEEENKKLKKQVKDYKQAIKQAKASILNAYNNRPRE